jgi:serine/threonine-protein kinase
VRVSSSERFPPKPGSTLDGRFLIQEVLGCGGTSAVMAVQDLERRQVVAIKVLHPELARSTDTVTRFLLAARASARLRSDHVVHVTDVATLSSGVPYFVMEYLAGADLGALLEEGGPLPFEDVIDYTLQALEALAEAHHFGIVHRDLTPANLFLTTREDDTAFIKVLDFGVSKLSGWEVTDEGVITRRGTILGSPLYMSPEQIQDASRVDARSDIWSLGAVIHELLTGRPPFEGADVPSVIHAIFRAPYEPPPEMGLPAELVAILRRCLKKSRDERYPNVQALARAFQPLARSYSTQVSIERILRLPTSAPSRPSAPPARAFDLDPNELARAAVDIDGESFQPIERDTLPSIPNPRRRGRWQPAALALVGLAAGTAALYVFRQFRELPAFTSSGATEAQGAAAAAPPTPAALTARASPTPVASASASSGVQRASPPPSASTHPKPTPASPVNSAPSASEPSAPTPSARSSRALDADNPFAK